MNLNKLKKIHFVGIGGIGISYVAHFFLEKGIHVSGSDLSRSIVTDQLAQRGAELFEGHSEKHLNKNTDLVIYNDAIPEDNPELQKAKLLGIPIKTNFQVVGELSKEYTTIVVAGNKGKTTTTAMISTILEIAGCNPTAMVGSVVNDWKCNYRAGGDQYLVVEGDEFKEHFLEIDADIAVITNMAPDHMDYYKTEENLIRAFQTFVDKLPKEGLLVINADDEMTKVIKPPKCPVKKFSLSLQGDVNAEIQKTENGRQYFKVIHSGHSLGEWSLGFPGKFNVANALAAATVALHLGVDPKLIDQGLTHFAGTWRRFQVLGEVHGATVINDYAHHPTAVHATIEAAKDFYHERRLIAVFQPHTRHRTQALFNDFAAAFDEADLVMIPDIYDVAGRELISKEEMNSKMLANAIRERGRNQTVLATGDLQDTNKHLHKTIESGDVVLVMGAGDVYLMAEEIVHETAYQQFKDKFEEITKENERLSKYSTFKIGGPAEVFVQPKTSEELAEVFQYIQKNDLHYFILGGGANVLLPDDGIKGIVIRPRNRGLKIEGDTVYAEAGLPLAKLAQETAKAGLTGLEWCIAVPGTVGGAVRGNAGAFGGEVKDTLIYARVADEKTIKELSNQQLNFRYRSSRIKDKQGEEVVLDAVFKLQKADAAEAQKRVKDMLKKKFSDQPMGELCAGCLFKNIELIPGKKELSSASHGNPTEKFFADIESDHPEFIENGKVPAGWIIEKLGYKEKSPHKGIKVSEKHANFLVNTGEGDAAAVKELAEIIKKDASDTYGITLEEEVQFVK
jgi:UDP-N-acetylmuramate--L-alanine ligase/UDP-N-acetylenolpyruvoylglucosamine reductase